MCKKRRSLIALATLGFATALTTTHAFADVPLPPPAYQNVEIDCLDELVTIYRYNFVNSQRSVITPSGIFHIIEYFEWDEAWYGQTYGNWWVGHGISPGAQNGVPGQRGVRQWIVHMKLTPVEGNDGPSFMYNYRFKLTANANGEQKVFYLPQSIDDWNIRCVGPK